MGNQPVRRANTIREQQGEINADTHRRIVEEGQ